MRFVKEDLARAIEEKRAPTTWVVMFWEVTGVCLDKPVPGVVCLS